MNYRSLPGVNLNRFLHSRVSKIGSEFRCLTGKTICITDGPRTPLQQAKLLLGALQSGSDLRIYRNSVAARQIREAYSAARARYSCEDDTVAMLAGVIETQLSRGIVLSKHLLGLAVDIRSRNLSSREKNLLRKAAEPHASRVIEETRPPHFHVEFEP